MRTPKRRFVGLKVGEVSLVDSPANEVEFIVTKNLEDGEMAEQQTANAAERVSIEQPATEGEDVSKALQHVAAIVGSIESIMKANQPSTPAPAPAAEAPATEPPAAPASGPATDPAPALPADSDVEKAAKSGNLGALLKALGYTGKGYDDALGKLKKQFGLDANAGFQNLQAPIAKSDEPKPAEAPAAETTTKTADPLDALGILAEAVSKAKVFTPDRVAKLQSAIETLKLLIAEITPNTSPATTVPVGPSVNTSAVQELTQPSAQPVIKSAGDQPDAQKLVDAAVAKAIAPLNEQIATLKTELESVQKAKPASNSLGEEGGTDTKKSAGSMWSGLI